MKRISAPPRRDPAEVRAALAEQARTRHDGKPRTPAEVDQALDLILEHLELTDR